MIKNVSEFLPVIKNLHAQIRDAVVAECECAALEDLSQIAKEEEGDTIYAIDRVSEKVLVEFIEREIAPHTPVVLIAEGIENGKIVLPRSASEDDALWRIIVDPIDGTRGLMYQKRSAWILTGIAPNNGAQTNIADVELAVQTEIPLVKQHLSDMLWAERDKGAHAERYNRISNESTLVMLQPSSSATIAHGFASMSRFFAGIGTDAADIYEEIVHGALGPVQPGKAHCFEDQYISTGGQLYELIAGHDRFIADLRPVFEKSQTRRGATLGICCHPYDLCTELIAREYGVIVTDENGRPVSAPLNLEHDVTWVGYANAAIRDQLAPLLKDALEKRGLLAEGDDA